MEDIIDNNIMVSIICNTYNHEKFIGTALDGFVSQKTDYRFEIIVHDDASTDGTAEIIRKYANKYPNLVVPIYQQYNQYSKGVDIFQEYTLPISRGKYIAICEGDDYWCDKMKIQKQVDFLEHHNEYSSCCSNSIIENYTTGEKNEYSNSKEDHDISFEEVICHRGLGSYQMSSLMYRKELADRRFEEKPPIFGIEQHVGDYPLRIYLLMNGKTRFFAENMSVYRLFTPGSWSEGEKKQSSCHKIEHYKTIIKQMHAVDDYTGYRCHSEIEKDINWYEMEIAYLTGDYGLYRKALSSPYNPTAKSVKTRIQLIFGNIYGVYWERKHRK